jgi:hypothetical protein
MAQHTVALQALDRGPDADAALGRLADALGLAQAPAPDETGVIVEVPVEAEDFEGALQKVWDAIAAAGADDHVAFAEHPDIPEHWRRRGVDGEPGALA